LNREQPKRERLNKPLPFLRTGVWKRQKEPFPKHKETCRENAGAHPGKLRGNMNTNNGKTLHCLFPFFVLECYCLKNYRLQGRDAGERFVDMMNITYGWKAPALGCTEKCPVDEVEVYRG